jgi:hypothetical protein
MYVDAPDQKKNPVSAQYNIKMYSLQFMIILSYIYPHSQW